VVREQPLDDDLTPRGTDEAGAGAGQEDLGHPAFRQLSLKQVFTEGDSHGQRSLPSYAPAGRRVNLLPAGVLWQDGAVF
jgi:hypothetical protein